MRRSVRGSGGVGSHELVCRGQLLQQVEVATFCRLLLRVQLLLNAVKAVLPRVPQQRQRALRQLPLTRGPQPHAASGELRRARAWWRRR